MRHFAIKGTGIITVGLALIFLITTAYVLQSFRSILKDTGSVQYRLTGPPPLSLIGCMNLVEDRVEEEVCLSQLAQYYSRVWPRKPAALWCGPSDNQTHAVSRVPQDHNGILVNIKVPKSASSTITGVILRLHSAGCNVRWQHQKANEYGSSLFANGTAAEQSRRNKTFVVAPIRLADRRSLSSVYYYHVTLSGRTRTPQEDDFVIRSIEKEMPNYITDYLSPKQLAVKNQSGEILERHVEEIVRSFDFLFVAERVHESLVAWSYLTSLPLQHFLHVTAKASGSWYHQSKKGCLKLVKPIVTDGMKAYFESATFRANQVADRLLYKVANTSLTRTIQTIPDFETRLDTFGRMWAHVQSACANISVDPCDMDGNAQLNVSAKECYIRDFGCGYRCIDGTLETWKL